MSDQTPQLPEKPLFPGQPMIKTREGKDFPVPPDGSLGLLALGYRGIMMWRESRKAAKAAGVWKEPVESKKAEEPKELDPDAIDPTMF